MNSSTFCFKIIASYREKQISKKRVKNFDTGSSAANLNKQYWQQWGLKNDKHCYTKPILLKYTNWHAISNTNAKS